MADIIENMGIIERKVEIEHEQKKAALVSLLANLSFGKRATGFYDKYYLREMLLKIYGRSSVDVVGNKNSSNKDFDFYRDSSETDLNQYDEIWMYADNPNLFGGIFPNFFIDTFKGIINYTGQIYILVNDPLFMPNTYYNFLNNKKEWTMKKYGKSGLYLGDNNVYEISDEDIQKFVDKMNTAITAFIGHDYMKLYNYWIKNPKASTNLILNKNNEVVWCEVPVIQYYAINDTWEEKMTDYSFENRTYDFVYYGRDRADRRKKLAEYMDDSDYNNYVIQKVQPWTHCKVEVNPNYIKHEQLFGELCKAYASLIIEGDIHTDNILTARYCECMLADIVAFIDISYDPHKKLVQNEFLKNFIYVSNHDELKEKFLKIKTDKELFNKIVNLEREEIKRIYNELFN